MHKRVTGGSSLSLCSILSFRRRREGEVFLHNSELKLIEVGLLTLGQSNVPHGCPTEHVRGGGVNTDVNVIATLHLSTPTRLCISHLFFFSFLLIFRETGLRLRLPLISSTPFFPSQLDTIARHVVQQQGPRFRHGLVD